jgi:hypothetical protein
VEISNDVQIPRVCGCNVGSCAYNDARECHAPAVIIGGPEGRMCDIFVRSSIKCGSDGITGRINECKARVCRFNDRSQCVAREVTVISDGIQPRCEMFAARKFDPQTDENSNERSTAFHVT